MNAALCYITALKVLADCSSSEDIARADRVSLPGDYRLCLTALEAERLIRIYGAPASLHVIASRSENYQTQWLRCRHIARDALKDGFIKLEDGLLVMSPEHCLATLCADLEIVDAVRLINWMAGTYKLGFDTKLFERNPLVREQSFLSRLNRIERLHGIKTARRAAQYASYGSASPLESTIAVLFTLPRALGGCGFDGMRMNHRIDLSPDEQAQLESAYIKCDFLWPDAGIAVEYDSDAHHTGSERIARDSIRRNILTGKGITVLTLTRQQLKNFAQFDAFARSLVRHLKIRLRRTWDDRLEERRQLHARLVLDDPDPRLVEMGFGVFWK